DTVDWANPGTVRDRVDQSGIQKFDNFLLDNLIVQRLHKELKVSLRVTVDIINSGKK
ncbi:hypothetical protein Tco_0557877, partial [Tanacetum coccineum]